MVTHIVLFRFTDPADAHEARRLLLGMQGRIAGLSSVEAGLDFTKSSRSFDLGLITRHDSREALISYQTDPVHEEVVAYIRPRASSSAAVDFEEAPVG